VCWRGGAGVVGPAGQSGPPRPAPAPDLASPRPSSSSITPQLGPRTATAHPPLTGLTHPALGPPRSLLQLTPEHPPRLILLAGFITLEPTHLLINGRHGAPD